SLLLSDDCVRKGMLNGSPRSRRRYVVKENPKDVTDKASTVDVVKDRALDIVKDVNRLDYDI
ncbi:hypothetical protein Tco_0915072, partial [Tanacetum coccineum]